jgi:hypothetical protein
MHADESKLAKWAHAGPKRQGSKVTTLASSAVHLTQVSNSNSEGAGQSVRVATERVGRDWLLLSSQTSLPNFDSTPRGGR